MPIADIDYKEYLDEESITRIKTIFDKYAVCNIDGTHENAINENELGAMFKELGHALSRRQIVEVITEVDFDGSGGIEIEEFYVMNIKLNKLWPRPDLIDYRDYLPEVKITHVQKAFELCDPEGRGWVEEEEFVDNMLAQLKIQPDDNFLDAVLKQAIPDGSGRMNLDQCCACFSVLSRTRRRLNYREFLATKEVDHFRKIFDANDSNHDDAVGRDELDRILQRLGFSLKPKQIKSLMRDFDADESGELDFEEFCVMMCRMCRKRRLRLISPETCKCAELYREEHFTVKELLLSGFKLPDLRKAGVAVREIYDEGITALDFRRAGYSAAQLRRAGVNLTQLRGCGFSLVDLRLAGFSDASVAEANRALRSSVSVGNLSLLAQCNPMSARTVYGPKDALKTLPTHHPLRLMTPLIRSHTDWNVFPEPPKSKLSVVGASVLSGPVRVHSVAEIHGKEHDDQAP